MPSGIVAQFRQFESTEATSSLRTLNIAPSSTKAKEPSSPRETNTAPSSPKSKSSGDKKTRRTRRSTISILLDKNTQTVKAYIGREQGVTLAKALARNAKKNAKKRVQKKMSDGRGPLKKRYEETRARNEEIRARNEETRATLIQKRVRGMLVRMKKQKKKQKKKKISTKTVDQLMLKRRSRARSLLGAEQEDTVIGKILTKKISTKTVDQLMLKRPGAKSLLGTDTVKSKHSGNEDSGIEEVDRLMRLRPRTPLRPDTPALSALGKSGGIRRMIAKIDSMMAKIKKTPDNDVRSRFSTGQSVVLWENNRWVPCTIVGWENNHWDIHKIGANAKAIANDDDLMPMTYVEESLASILKRKLDEINETMERIGAKQIEGFRITMETISKVIRKTMEEEHDAIWNRFQTSIQSLEARLGEIRAAALNHNSFMHQ